MDAMNSQMSEPSTAENDPLIDEVRQIRREIGERNNHDLVRMFDELRTVERDFAERRGVFSAVSETAASRVESSWGDLSGPGRDPLVDEIRAVRSGNHTA